MLTFFRKIRKSFLSSGRLSKYMLYAVGEVLLVMIGILLALQVNNWNESRKQRLIEKEAYRNLLIALKKDTLELARILDFQSKSVEAQLKIIKSDSLQFLSSIDDESFIAITKDLMRGNQSFFPKYGTYNAILSHTGLDILTSNDIKSRLIDYYDYQCKRYENIDAVIDRKFADDMESYLYGHLRIFMDYDYTYISGFNRARLEKSYDQLVIQCYNTYNWLEAGRQLLIEMQESVKELIDLIELELNSF